MRPPFIKIESPINPSFLFKKMYKELPEDVLAIIKDFSRPVTRPDWRTLHLMPLDTYLNEVYVAYMARVNYLSNHPDRVILCDYKSIFCGFNYTYMVDMISMFYEI